MTEGIMTAAFGIEAATETPPAMTTAMAEEDMAMPIGITAVAGSMTVEVDTTGTGATLRAIATHLHMRGPAIATVHMIAIV
ncbi:hypothetical protein CYMTET_44440 [Cymbomonas tetramitiformis]|nr:hypothetical protein CYMTET_44440 [Cymbomonas tetramitiformis]